MTVKVKAHPKSKKQEIKELSENSFEIWVHEAPVDGKANQKIIELLAKYFKVAKTTIVLKSGANAKLKTFEL